MPDPGSHGVITGQSALLGHSEHAIDTQFILGREEQISRRDGQQIRSLSVMAMTATS
jgi:hypothetical protein